MFKVLEVGELLSSDGNVSLQRLGAFVVNVTDLRSRYTASRYDVVLYGGPPDEHFVRFLATMPRPTAMVLVGGDNADLARGYLKQGVTVWVPSAYASPAYIAEQTCSLIRSRMNLAADALPSDGNVIKCGDIVVDLVKATVTRAGTRILLQSREFQLLGFFMQHPHMMYSREQLIEGAWGPCMAPESVRAYISRLRKALCPDKAEGRQLFQSDGRGGYSFMPPPTSV